MMMMMMVDYANVNYITVKELYSNQSTFVRLVTRYRNGQVFSARR